MPSFDEWKRLQHRRDAAEGLLARIHAADPTTTITTASLLEAALEIEAADERRAIWSSPPSAMVLAMRERDRRRGRWIH